MTRSGTRWGTILATGAIGLAVLLGPSPLAAQMRGRTTSKLELEAQLRVSRGLQFLASRQNPDGSWTEKIGRKVHLEYRGQMGKHVGVTGLAAMAFLASGSLPGRGLYAENVERALDYVINNTQENGFVSANESRMYSHAFATLFLAEIYGMTGMERVRSALKKAVTLIVQAQNHQGGWRYQPGAEDADMSITVCQVMALRAARNAGIHVPKEVIDQAIEYVKLSFVERSGGIGAFLYQHESLPGGGRQRSRYTFPLTAAGVTALYGAGDYDSEYITKGIRYLQELKFPRRHAQSSFDYYYGMYYATQAMFQRGGREWERWQRDLWTDLFSLQQHDGRWVDLVGPHYATAMACIILQMPYMYLPIFER